MLAPVDQYSEIESVPGLEVLLPNELKAFFYETGYTPTTAEEARTNARLRVRSLGDLLFVHTPTVLREGLKDDRTKRAGKVLIKDLSRGGIGVLYHQQIFPEEQFQIRFQGRLIHAVVVRCRRLGERCFEIGGRIISLETL